MVARNRQTTSTSVIMHNEESFSQKRVAHTDESHSFLYKRNLYTRARRYYICPKKQTIYLEEMLKCFGICAQFGKSAHVLSGKQRGLDIPPSYIYICPVADKPSNLPCSDYQQINSTRNQKYWKKAQFLFPVHAPTKLQTNQVKNAFWRLSIYIPCITKECTHNNVFFFLFLGGFRLYPTYQINIVRH